MIAILSVLAVVSLSVLITRFASIALQLTGLSRETARFQARSAFTGVGFTTNEAESVMIHPDRRRIIMILMLLGSAGVASAIAGLMISFSRAGTASELVLRGAVLTAGLLLLTAFAHSAWIEHHLARVIEWSLRRVTDLEEQAYTTLLDVRGDYTVAQVRIEPASWFADSAIEDLNLSAEGVIVLGVIRHDGSYVGSPRGRYTLRERDTVILYGPADRLREIQQRVAGAAGRDAQEQARDEHLERLAAQDARPGM
jgi:K+/H+ antiporter YhaU regulatory subunit KhtT